ncbi:hypothetical protein B0H16DRAFT_1892096 [Mycena metata]|uniref:Uncharacterized protein n=1 Tax=Mycena metata TaxID=1033252 RepID=A0AAD7MWE0_9AGAR|nr:hypothetical protein B0H16DRAFT_1892096 [Mycena metata]
MPGSKHHWTLFLTRAHEDNSYDLVPADPDHDPLLSSTENSTAPPSNRCFDHYTTAVARRNRLHIPPSNPSALKPPPVTVKLDPNDPVDAARLHVDALFARQSATYARAAARYSLKTGRAPPRGYDKWFAFAQEHDEYDQIQRDFAPFYQLAKDDPSFFQSRVYIAVDVKQPISEAGGLVVKDGQVHMPQGVDLRYSILGRRACDIQQSERSFAHLLPGMTFIVNGKDQPRVVFDYREPGNATRDRALSLTENGQPFELVPQPTTAQFFRERPGCEVLRGADGFADVTNDDSGCAWFLSGFALYSTAI